jgi:hypothetical protein
MARLVVSRHSVRYWLTAYDRGDIDNDQDTTSCPTFRKVTVSDAELIGDCLKKDPFTHYDISEVKNV